MRFCPANRITGYFRFSYKSKITLFAICADENAAVRNFQAPPRKLGAEVPTDRQRYVGNLRRDACFAAPEHCGGSNKQKERSTKLFFKREV
jgi:hypothetical protein